MIQPYKSNLSAGKFEMDRWEAHKRDVRLPWFSWSLENLSLFAIFSKMKNPEFDPFGVDLYYI
jgi:hypothetical protein